MKIRAKFRLFSRAIFFLILINQAAFIVCANIDASSQPDPDPEDEGHDPEEHKTKVEFDQTPLVQGKAVVDINKVNIDQSELDHGALAKFGEKVFQISTRDPEVPETDNLSQTRVKFVQEYGKGGKYGSEGYHFWHMTTEKHMGQIIQSQKTAWFTGDNPQCKIETSTSCFDKWKEGITNLCSGDRYVYVNRIRWDCPRVHPVIPTIVLKTIHDTLNIPERILELGHRTYKPICCRPQASDLSTKPTTPEKKAKQPESLGQPETPNVQESDKENQEMFPVPTVPDFHNINSGVPQKVPKLIPRPIYPSVRPMDELVQVKEQRKQMFKKTMDEVDTQAMLIQKLNVENQGAQELELEEIKLADLKAESSRAEIRLAQANIDLSNALRSEDQPQGFVLEESTPGIQKEEGAAVGEKAQSQSPQKMETTAGQRRRRRSHPEPLETTSGPEEDLKLDPLENDLIYEELIEARREVIQKLKIQKTL